jgi:hypothetical protein
MFLTKSEPKNVETRVYLEEMAARSKRLAQRLPKEVTFPRMTIVRSVTPLALVDERSFERAHPVRVNTDANPATFGGYN